MKVQITVDSMLSDVSSPVKLVIDGQEFRMSTESAREFSRIMLEASFRSSLILGFEQK